MVPSNQESGKYPESNTLLNNFSYNGRKMSLVDLICSFSILFSPGDFPAFKFFIQVLISSLVI